MKSIHLIAFTLLAVGGLNWLLVGIIPSGWEIGQIFGGQDATISKIIYILVGLSALVEIFTHSKSCKRCDSRVVEQSQTSPI
ncbi:MAG: hypothetical protein A3G59_00985 [Candidatus Taylorbacteria bacterium RIFCSPLOWO2_12_FULL_47_20]|uniref:DUF378 domain-containing protein n=2 Tax=Candidatus Tayloriibacteriota TaxID=1817919 RepID=A0A1G2PAJ0_9BACT|nr:MAG: hypothetical protein A3H68_00285 [Candidatus Taylorbacteria bacterium RIFCSPLOWO2_02_FULL_46_40]OHA44729.1 MAG: hypothetical protein A3G59_00985 [Candidatus Taylorbacteria bacterium RIFCSPLOWO2_12_FULL_47_20]